MNKYLTMFVIKQELKLNTLPHSITQIVMFLLMFLKILEDGLLLK